MKKLYSILLGAAFVASSSVASAQQLPNANFDGSWVDCVPWTSKSNTKTCGVQPEGWCISHVIGMNGIGKTAVGDKVAGGFDGSAYAAKLVHTANPYKKTEIVPGYMTLGTSWATSKGATTISNKDGGVFGGYSFAYKPDAISFYYQRSHGTSNPNEPASVIVYSWKGTWSQADVPGNNVLGGSAATVTMVDRDKNILGMKTDQGGAVTKTEDAELIATLNYSIQGDASTWTRFEQPLEYKTASTPEKINVIISAGDYFGGPEVVGEGNTLIVDNVSFVYYSRLSALSVNGVAVEGFASDVYNYTMSGTQLPTEDQISATLMGQSAATKVIIDENAATVTIGVGNVGADSDGQQYHTYVLQYEKASAKEGVSTDYPGYLNGSILDPESTEKIPFAENDAKTITITEYEDGTCDFLLPNFSLASMGLELGDILIENATVTKDANGVATYNGFVDDMALLGGELVADVTLGGTITAEGVVDMKIDVLWDGIPIECTFTSYEVNGVEDVIVEDNLPAVYYNLQGVKVANPENGVFIKVKGGKATKVLVK